jgi:hypothetical protein
MLPANAIVMVFEPSAVQAVVLSVVKVTVDELSTDDRPAKADSTVAAVASNARAEVVWPPNESVNVPPVAVHTAV